jgi:hypothetical protein
MKLFVGAFTVLVAAGCATVQPYKATTASSKTASDAFNCALGLATSLTTRRSKSAKNLDSSKLNITIGQARLAFTGAQA